jgi:hypothetical protein
MSLPRTRRALTADAAPAEEHLGARRRSVAVAGRSSALDLRRMPMPQLGGTDARNEVAAERAV